MSIETRSTSALFKRADQLKRWQESDTFREPAEPKTKTRKIQFTDGCVFLASCAAGDKDEVDKLLKRGADIDTTNVDGLTALHQACIDDNLEMVEFLVQRGADVNRGDNEGWTPLHATASCGFLSIAKFLLDHGASVSAVNNDGELAIDISESDEMEELLQKEIDAQGVNCEASRRTEEHMMLEDARGWLNSKYFGDVAHTKTGATALHVAAAKGYIKVIGLLIQAGAAVNSQDLDGWTPLHAAAHWAQREACEILCENFCNMEIKNHVGRTSFDVADPDVVELLEQLKKKQATMQKDRPDIKNLINRPPVPSFTATASVSSSHHQISKRRSSITRLSVDDKAQRYKDVSTQERETLTKASMPETIQEKASENHTSSFLGRDEKIPNFTPPQIEEKDNKSHTLNSSSTTSGDSLDVYPWRRPASLRIRPTNSLSQDASSVGSNRLSPSVDSDSLRRNHSFEDRRRNDTEFGASFRKEASKSQQQQDLPVRRSFVPPVRDEESETQRKAHAKRVRGTRRSTQGVTLEDLKSAEQLVKKKQQLENQQRTSELQQLVASQQKENVTESKTHKTITGSNVLTTSSRKEPGTPTTPGTPEGSSTNDKLAAWKLRQQEANKAKFQTEENSRSQTLSVSANQRSTSTNDKNKVVVPTKQDLLLPTITRTPSDQRDPPRDTSVVDGGSSPSHHSVTRKKKPKRRSTGVVNFEETGADEEDDESYSSDSKRDAEDAGQNGVVDYKKLWEEAQISNSCLREDLAKVREELGTAKKKWENSLQAVANNGLSDTEKKEKKALEKKLSEMEEELKQLEHLKNDNQRLRDENGALIRVISKLSK